MRKQAFTRDLVLASMKLEMSCTIHTLQKYLLYVSFQTSIVLLNQERLAEGRHTPSFL